MIFSIESLKSFQVILIQISVHNVLKSQCCSQFVNFNHFKSQLKIRVDGDQIHQLVNFCIDFVFKTFYTVESDLRSINNIVAIISLNSLKSLHLFLCEVFDFDLLTSNFRENIGKFLQENICVFLNILKIIRLLYSFLNFNTLILTFRYNIT